MLTRSKGKISEKQFKEILEKNSKKEKENVKNALSGFKNDEIIKMIGKTHPWLNIKETTFPGLKYDDEDESPFLGRSAGNKKRIFFILL